MKIIGIEYLQQNKDDTEEKTEYSINLHKELRFMCLEIFSTFLYVNINIYVLKFIKSKIQVT